MKGAMAFTAITRIPKNEEIFTSANTNTDILNDIKKSMELLLIIGIVVLLVLSLGIICYIYRYSDHVIEPINLLQDRVKQIAEGNLDVNVINDTGSNYFIQMYISSNVKYSKKYIKGNWQEIDACFHNFEILNQIVKSGDDKNYSDLSAETLIKYSNAFLMFEKLDNRKGMGIVLNNMGNINMKLGRIEEAINSYKQAFQIAERDLLELILVDNTFGFYGIKPFNGWDPTKKYDFTYNYHFYAKMMNRPKSLLVCTANKPLFEIMISNRSYQLAKAYLEGYYINTNIETKQEYLSNCIDYFKLTEKLDNIHNKTTSRSIFTRLKLSQALTEKYKYFISLDPKKYADMYFLPLEQLCFAFKSLKHYEQMYSLFDENFKNEVPPEIINQHYSLQAGIINRELLNYKDAINLFTECLRKGIHYDPYVREQCLQNIKEILEIEIENKNKKNLDEAPEKLIDLAPGLIKLIQNNFEKKQKDIVFILDFSHSMQFEMDYQLQENSEDFLQVKEPKEQSQKNIALYKFLNIFDDFVQNNDRVAFIKFNENVDVIFELNEKGNNTKFLRNSIQRQIKEAPSGESAVRQAIYTGFKLFQKTIPKDHSKWIVVFTDGGDSCSRISEPELMKILSEGDADIMIIGCGLDKYSTKIFRQICEKTKNGIFIKTNQKQSEINIAFQAITNKIYGNSDLNYNVEAFL